MQIYILMMIAGLSLVSSFYDSLYADDHKQDKEKTVKDLIEKHSYKEKQKDVFCFDHDSGYIYLDSLYDITKYFWQKSKGVLREKKYSFFRYIEIKNNAKYAVNIFFKMPWFLVNNKQNFQFC